MVRIVAIELRISAGIGLWKGKKINTDVEMVSTALIFRPNFAVKYWRAMPLKTISSANGAIIM